MFMEQLLMCRLSADFHACDEHVPTRGGPRFVMKQQEGATHGGFTAKDENQQLLEDEDDAGQPGPSGAQGGSQGPGMVQPGGPGQLEILPGVLADASGERPCKIQGRVMRPREVLATATMLCVCGGHGVAPWAVA